MENGCDHRDLISGLQPRLWAEGMFLLQEVQRKGEPKSASPGDSGLDRYKIQSSGMTGKLQIQRNQLPASVQPNSVGVEFPAAARSIDCEAHARLTFRAVSFNVAESEMVATEGVSQNTSRNGAGLSLDKGQLRGIGVSRLNKRQTHPRGARSEKENDHRCAISTKQRKLIAVILQCGGKQCHDLFSIADEKRLFAIFVDTWIDNAVGDGNAVTVDTRILKIDDTGPLRRRRPNLQSFQR